jgi:hypothetical protein
MHLPKSLGIPAAVSVSWIPAICLVASTSIEPCSRGLVELQRTHRKFAVESDLSRFPATMFQLWSTERHGCCPGTSIQRLLSSLMLFCHPAPGRFEPASSRWVPGTKQMASMRSVAGKYALKYGGCFHVRGPYRHADAVSLFPVLLERLMDAPAMKQ